MEQDAQRETSGEGGRQEDILDLLKKDPRALRIPRGVWTVRDISKAVKEEGVVNVGPDWIHCIFNDLGLKHKRPKLTVES